MSEYSNVGYPASYDEQCEECGHAVHHCHCDEDIQPDS